MPRPPRGRGRGGTVAEELLAHFRAARRQVAKWSHYFPIYERLLSPHRGRSITLVEVGVGDGGSLEGWRGYLGPSARIIGIDCDPAAKRLQWLAHPARRAMGIALRTSTRIADASRVRQYFR
jgi:hypothetical protein